MNHHHLFHNHRHRHHHHHILSKKKVMNNLDGRRSVLVCCLAGDHRHSKGLQLSALPRGVLTLHLKRFALDYTTWQRVKLEDKVKIPLRIDMGPYLAAGAAARAAGEGAGEGEGEWVYELASLMIHVGGAYRSVGGGGGYVRGGALPSVRLEPHPLLSPCAAHVWCPAPHAAATTTPSYATLPRGTGSSSTTPPWR